MIIRPNITAAAGDRDEELFVRRAAELASRAEYAIVLSDFLSPREQLLFAASTGGRNAGFWGGAFGCDRRLGVLVPEWLENDSFAPVFSRDGEELARSLLSSADEEELSRAIAVLLIRGSGYAELTHRDHLGALLALGLKRSVIGDIEIVDKCSAHVFVLEKCADFIIQNLTSVGRDTVRVSRCAISAEHEIKRSFAPILGTVASPRLDCVIAELLPTSRSDAAAAISVGNVDVNYRTATRVDQGVNDGDILSVRGHGKYVLTAFGDLNRRGRIRFEAKKYT